MYVGAQAIVQLQGKIPLQISPAMDIFKQLVASFDSEGRYHLFNAMANQLRYPNRYVRDGVISTYYCSSVVLQAGCCSYTTCTSSCTLMSDSNYPSYSLFPSFSISLPLSLSKYILTHSLSHLRPCPPPSDYFLFMHMQSHTLLLLCSPGSIQ